MILGIYEKRCQVPLCESFLIGTNKSYKMIEIKDVRPSNLKGWEAVVLQGWTPTHLKIIKELECDYYCLSDGFFKRWPKEGNKSYYCAAKNGLHAHGEQSLVEHNCARWQKIGEPMKPWQDDGKYIIVAYQDTIGPFGEDRDPAYQRMVASAINTGRPVKITCHPAGINKKRNILNGFSNLGAEIVRSSSKAHFSNAYCLMTYDSNVAVEAIFSGIPVITESKTMADRVSSPSLNDLRYPDRSEWCCWLAYQQWTLEEMKKGLCWRYII